MSRPFNNRRRRGGRKLRGAMPINRRDGRWKLSDPMTEFAYEMAMNSSDDFLSNEAWGDSATLVSGGFNANELRTFHGSTWGFLTRWERMEVLGYFGCIVRESGDGSVSVEWFESPSQLYRAWDDVSDDFPEEESAESAWTINDRDDWSR